MSVQAGLTYLCSFNVYTCGDCLRLSFVMKNRRFFLLFLLRIPCFALQFFCHDGHSDVLAEACFCTNRRMGIICILMFLCLYYFMFRALAGIVPSLRSDPWSRPGMTASLVLVMFCGCLGVWGRMWGLVVFVLGARERIFEGSEVLLRGLGICKAGLCKVKRALR